MNVCLACLGPVPPGTDYHPACLTALFGVARVPRLDLDLPGLYRRMSDMVGNLSISGAQPKLSLRLSADHASLEVAPRRGVYILKPQTERFPHLPENEHASMNLARLIGLRVPAFGLVRLRDDSLAYLIRRFDRVGDPPRKLRQVDFCQLAGRLPQDKDLGSAEDCAALCRAHAAAPATALRQLFLLFAFSFWIHNGDLHLKNLSLLEGGDGGYHLSPAYDLCCTSLYLRRQELLMPLRGRQKLLTRHDFLEFAAGACELPREEAGALVDRMLGALPEAIALLNRSLLPGDDRRRVIHLLRKRTRSLGGATTAA